jgi:diaminopimelate epimerase
MGRGTVVKAQWLVAVLTVVNLVILVFAFALIGRLESQSVPSVVRAHAFQLVDEQGRVRASLKVMPATTHDGETYAESVLLRLITERGRPAVKISASEQSAGLSFAGPTGTSSTYVILQSKGTESSLTLKNEDGREQVIKP